MSSNLSSVRHAIAIVFFYGSDSKSQGYFGPLPRAVLKFSDVSADTWFPKLLFRPLQSVLAEVSIFSMQVGSIIY